VQVGRGLRYAGQLVGEDAMWEVDDGFRLGAADVEGDYQALMDILRVWDLC
jgi:hypothetical protein